MLPSGTPKTPKPPLFSPTLSFCSQGQLHPSPTLLTLLFPHLWPSAVLASTLDDLQTSSQGPEEPLFAVICVPASLYQAPRIYPEILVAGIDLALESACPAAGSCSAVR